MRALAVDFGGKRIGIAVGESGTGVVSPRSDLAASGTLARDAQAIKEIAQKEEADLVVVGLPLLDGDLGKAARVCKKLGEALQAIGVETDYIDEALTSAEAENEMAAAGLKGSERRKRSDGEAACRILERFFERNQ